MKKKKVNKGVVIYQAKNGAIELRGDISHESIWTSLDQIAVVFGRDKSVISRHLKNILDIFKVARNDRFIPAKNDCDLIKTSPNGLMRNVATQLDGSVFRLIYHNSFVYLFLFHDNSRPFYHGHFPLKPSVFLKSHG